MLGHRQHVFILNILDQGIHRNFIFIGLVVFAVWRIWLWVLGIFSGLLLNLLDFEISGTPNFLTLIVLSWALEWRWHISLWARFSWLNICCRVGLVDHIGNNFSWRNRFSHHLGTILLRRLNSSLIDLKISIFLIDLIFDPGYKGRGRFFQISIVFRILLLVRLISNLRTLVWLILLLDPVVHYLLGRLRYLRYFVILMVRGLPQIHIHLSWVVRTVAGRHRPLGCSQSIRGDPPCPSSLSKCIFTGLPLENLVIFSLNSFLI